MKNKNKTIVLGLLVVALIALVTGTAFALSIIANRTGNLNTIDLGRISMSYTEPTNAYVLENALPMSDDEGKNQENYFEFTVTSHATTNESDTKGVKVPYEINISPIEIDSGMTLLPSSKIKVHLTKIVGNSETEVVSETIIDDLTQSTLNTNGKIVYENIDTHKQGNDEIVTRYRLRAWIDKGYVINNNDTKTYQYKFRVNINSHVEPLIQDTHQITYNEGGGGTINIASNALVGSKVDFNVNPISETCTEYAYNGATIINTLTNEKYLTLDNETTTFEMPSYDITITPSFIVAKEYLYNTGTVCSNLVGGENFIYRNTNEASVTNTASYLNITAHYTHDAYAITHSTIDFSKYTRIGYHIVHGAGNTHVQSYTSNTGIWTGQGENLFYSGVAGTTEEEVDLKVTSGNYYIAFRRYGADQPGTSQLYYLYLVPKH